MKRTTLLLAFMLICLAVFSRPRISNISAPTQVGVYDLYEISFTMNEYTNPYDPKVIDIYAIFHSPTGQTFHVNAFYINDNDQVDCIYWTPDYEWRKCSMPQVESGGRKINISSLATNYDGNVYFLTAKSKTGLNKPQIYRFFYKSQCFYESSTHIREQRDETNNDYKLIEATTDSMVTDPDNSASSHLPSVNIYPNPCSNNITISSDDEIEKVSIFDCAGSFVSSYDNIHSNTIIIDLSSYRNGLYIIKTQNQNGYTSVNKISKKS